MCEYVCGVCVWEWMCWRVGGRVCQCICLFVNVCVHASVGACMLVNMCMRACVKIMHISSVLLF